MRTSQWMLPPLKDGEEHPCKDLEGRDQVKLWRLEAMVRAVNSGFSISRIQMLKKFLQIKPLVRALNVLPATRHPSLNTVLKNGE